MAKQKSYYEDVIEEINELCETGIELDSDTMKNTMLKSIAKTLGRIADILEIMQ